MAARAQQQPMPVIGFLHSQSPDGFTEPLRGFRRGLKEAGFVEGDNVAVDYRWAENQTDRLPALVATWFAEGSRRSLRWARRRRCRPRPRPRRSRSSSTSATSR
jgi:hypothetical protein